MRTIIVFLFVSLLSCGFIPPKEYRIPADFRGWVLIGYEFPACPAAERRDGYRVIAIDRLSRGCVSDDLLEGTARRPFRYLLIDGSGREQALELSPDDPSQVGIHYPHTMSVGGNAEERRFFSFFFVGPATDLDDDDPEFEPSLEIDEMVDRHWEWFAQFQRDSTQ